MSGTTRRQVLAGMAAGLASPAMARPDEAGSALDAAARATPARGLVVLAGIDARALPSGRRLDVETARAGLTIDAELADRPDDFGLKLAKTLGTVDLANARTRIDRALADLLARAAPLFDAIGIAGSTIGARCIRLFAVGTGRYPDDAQGRAAATAGMNADLAVRTAAVAAQIDAVPAFCLDVKVQSLSDAEIAAGKEGYRIVPSPAHSGAYVVDLRDIARRPAWSLPSVVAHELLPGHMIQLGLETVEPPHPLRLAYASAFVEGWGIYAETLAARSFTDPRVMLGHLYWLIFRAARARVDVGIHLDGWSEDEALTRLAAWQGVPAYFAPFAADVARIVKEPGTRAAEALAWLALQDRAPRDATHRRRWHAALLAHGRKRLEQWP